MGLTCIHARLRSNLNCLHQPPFREIDFFCKFIWVFELSLTSEAAYKTSGIFSENDSTKLFILFWEEYTLSGEL